MKVISEDGEYEVGIERVEGRGCGSVVTHYIGGETVWRPCISCAVRNISVMFREIAERLDERTSKGTSQISRAFDQLMIDEEEEKNEGSGDH